MIKRTIDVVGSLGGLVLLSPVFAVIAFLIRVVDGPPVFFKQTRVGRNSAPFQILKFRTMRPASTGTQVTVAGDARITGIGRVLRRTKLDELPQLVNVLSGTMSLVGPRPEVPEYVEDWPADVRRTVLSVRPGITDPAALEFFDEEKVLADYEDPIEAYRTVVMPRKLKAYENYVATRSATSDIKIIFATIRRAFR